MLHLQHVKGCIGDAQGVKDAHDVLPTPDFAGALVSSLRHQALAVLDPAAA